MNDSNLHSKVINWLETQGYPLEMTLAKSFSKSGFEIQQPLHFLDPETNTIRETDMVVRCTDPVDF